MQEILLTFPKDISDKNGITKDDSRIDAVVVGPPFVVAGKVRSQTNVRRVAPACGDLFTASVSTENATETETVLEGPSRIVEKILRNGDMYSGGFLGRGPHGSGKYLWADGCMYEGEWEYGKASRRGRFSWPSGATYEGEFKDGRMDGDGTFIGVDGDTYRGHWLWGRKHGYGEKRYANGDHYEGNWKANLQDGYGRYVWSDGNEYFGEWKNGVISGKGELVWSNGNRYDGEWENGVPKGNGVFSWGAKNDRTGIRGKKWKNQKVAAAENEGMSAMARKRFSGDGETRNVNVPRICIWELDSEAGDITCDFVDNVEACSHYRDESESETSDSAAAMQSQRSSRWCDEDEVKRPGQTISVGHKNYDLMLNLQLGIRFTVSKHSLLTQELRQSDFDPNEKFWTRFPPEGSNVTPAHQSPDFKWKDYCPMVFRHLRDLFAIDPDEYVFSICGNDSLRELSSPGKSGCFFYLTQDERYIIKTVKKSELKVLTRMLPKYYKHVCEYKNTLVTKFIGVHCVKAGGSPKTRFIVMANVFCSEYRIHKRFDLKGSSHGRTIDKPEGEIDETTTLKDLDLNYVFGLETKWYQELIWQIDKDSEFLESEGIMDYSLLVGLHFRDDCFEDETSPKYMNLDKRSVDHDETSMRGYHLLPNMDWIMEGREPDNRLGDCMPGTAERVLRNEQDQQSGSGSSTSSPSQPRGERHDVILYFGIIDILQDYDITKKLEHAYKSLQADPTSISAVDPKSYSKRFRDFIYRIFVEN